MGGGGGGGPFLGRSPEELARMVQKTEDETAIKAFETDLSGILSELLSNANNRDSELIGERLGDIKDALGDALEETVDSLFGGSVAKHTYVDGLSDVDSLLVLNGTDIEGDKPSEAIAKLESIIHEAVGGNATVSSGKLAVTIEYKDGMELQLLPAFRQKDGIRVPSFTRDGWSSISPKAFQEALSQRNAECGGKLVPTIKLAKAVVSTLPESQRLSGYHVESLAIAAFRGYNGPKTTAAMLPTFFETAKNLVKRPIKDKTGQSLHVDNYLGAENSTNRIAMGHILDRIAKRMRNASAYRSHDQWKSIMGIGDG